MTKVYPVSEKQMVEKPPAEIVLIAFLWYHLIHNLIDHKILLTKKRSALTLHHR